MAVAARSERISFWHKVCFGLGDIFGGGGGVIISFFYLYFLTDVVRISPALAGTAFLVSKIYDAITDPLEGVLTDRTRTRLGRRKPYLIAGIPLAFIAILLLWYPVNLESETGRFAFVLAAYLFYNTIVSLIMVSYNALVSELSFDYHERTSISSVRIFFSTLASIVAAVLPLEIVKMFDDVRTGYMVMALFFGAFFTLPFIATIWVSRERPEFQKPVTHGIDLRELFIRPFQMKSFVAVLMMYLLAFTAMDAVSSIVIYYMKYYLLRGPETNYVSGVLLVAQVVSLPFYVYLSKRTSKRTGYLVGAIIWVAAMFTSLMIGPGSPGWAVYAFATVVGFGTGGIVIMIYAIFPDIPDIDELKSGERREGTYMALVTFMRKFSSALAIFMVSNIALAGYAAPVQEVVNGATVLVEQTQSAAFIANLRMTFVLLPVVMLAGAVIFAARYPLSPAVHARLRDLLACRRAGLETPDQQHEAAELAKVLI